MALSLDQFLSAHPDADESDYTDYLKNASPSAPSVSSAVAPPPPASDFKNRYATETAGMPANLAAVASRNLAAQDAAMARVNAVARMNPQQPDYSATFSSSPSSILNPQSSPDSVSLSDLHANDIATRRATIDEQRKQIQAKLGLISPRDAGFAAMTLAPAHEQPLLLHQLARLDAEDSSLLHEHHLNAIDAARTAHENLARQLHAQSANGLAKVLNGIASIKEPIGSDEHTTAALQILGSNDPDIAAARGTPGFDKILGPYAQQAKTSAERAARIKAAANEPADQYYSAEALLKENPGAEFRQDPKTGGFYVALGGQSGTARTGGKQDKLTSIVEGDLAKVGVRPEEFTQRENVRRGHLKDGQFSNNYSGAEKGSQVAFDVAGTTYTMPYDQFTRADKVHPIVPPTQNSTTPPAGPSPELKALAQRALSDPNASDEHKAAARKILGQ